GRPRSESARVAILAAAAAVLADVGYDRFSLGLVADAAGVGKATVYRWWPSKGSLIAAMLLAGDVELPIPAIDAALPTAPGLKSWVYEVMGLFRQSEHAAFIRGITAAAAEDDDVAAQLRGALMRPAQSMIAASVVAGGVGADLAA